MMSEENVIRMSGVSKVYTLGDVSINALDNVDLDVRKGEYLSVVGPSGSGKSTLLNMIGCIDSPSSGSVYLEGRDISHLSDRELTKIRLHKIGFVFQQFYLIPTLNALENVEFPMKEARVPREERRRRASELLEKVGLGNRLRHYPNQLSGGEQQRVAIARALANSPSIILADEPTGEVDSRTSDTIVGMLKDLNEREGMTVIVVTHDQEVARHGHRIIEMKDGGII